jgi:hypothetical protein
VRNGRGGLRHGDGKLHYLRESSTIAADAGAPAPFEAYLADNPPLAARLAGDPGLRALLSDMYAPSATRATAEDVLASPWLQVRVQCAYALTVSTCSTILFSYIGVCSVAAKWMR